MAYPDKKVKNAVVLWSPKTQQSDVLIKETDAPCGQLCSLKTVIPKPETVIAKYEIPTPIKGITLDGIDSQQSNAVVRGMLNKLRAPITFLGGRDSRIVGKDVQSCTALFHLC